MQKSDLIKKVPSTVKAKEKATKAECALKADIRKKQASKDVKEKVTHQKPKIPGVRAVNVKAAVRATTHLFSGAPLKKRRTGKGRPQDGEWGRNQVHGGKHKGTRSVGRSGPRREKLNIGK